MSVKLVAAHLESGPYAFAHEFDREVTVADHGYEQIALVLHQCADLDYVRGAYPVKPLADECLVDCREEEFVLSQSSEVEEIYVHLDSAGLSPGHDITFQKFETGFLHVYHDICCADFRQWNDSGRQGAGIFAKFPCAEKVFNDVKHSPIVYLLR